MLHRSQIFLCITHVSLCLILGTLILTANPAHAGSWTVTYQCSGTVSEDACFYPDSLCNPADASSWLPTAAPHYHVGEDFSAGEEYDEYGTTCDGTVTATLTWNASGANDPPPSQVYVVESAYVSASGGGTDDVDDGLGDAVVGEVCTGSKSQMLSTNGQTTVSLPQRHLRASTYFPEADLRDLYTEASASYSVSFPTPPGHWALGMSEFVDEFPFAGSDSTYLYDNPHLNMYCFTTYSGTGEADAVLTATGTQHFNWIGEGPTTNSFSVDYQMSAAGSASSLPAYQAGASTVIQFQEGLIGAAPNGDPDSLSYYYLKASPSSGPGTKQITCSGGFTAQTTAQMTVANRVASNSNYIQNVSDSSAASGYANATATLTFSNVRP